MYQKCAFALFLVAVVFATYAPSQAYVQRARSVYAANKSHHLMAGSRLPGDRLTHQEYVIKSSSLWQVTTIDRMFSAPKYERITQVLALDQTNNGTGGYATVIRGGPGLNNVTIRFNSQKNYGIKFLVQLYSRR